MNKANTMDPLAHSALETAQLPSLPELVTDLQRLIDRNEDITVIADLLATDAALVALGAVANKTGVFLILWLL